MILAETGVTSTININFPACNNVFRFQDDGERVKFKLILKRC